MGLFGKKAISPDDVWALAHSILRGVADAAALLDAELELVHWNRPFLTMAGLRPRMLTRRLESGKSLFDLLSQAPGKDLALARECLASGRSVHDPWVTVTNAHGESCAVMQTFVPITDSDGEAFALLVLYRDVSAEESMHAQYKELLAKETNRAESLEQQVEDRTAQLRAALDEVTRLSRTDPLTGLLNRRAFTEFAEQALKMAERYERSCALLMCDLDLFKSVNDTHGHLAGDRILCAVADAVSGVIRETDKVARFGGEEFIILLSETDPPGLARVADRIREAVAALPVTELVPDMTGPQTVSIGAAEFPEHGTTLDELVVAADKALYCAKEVGRNRVVLYGELDDLEITDSRILPVTGSKILLVDADPERRARYQACLAHRFAVVASNSTTEAHALCAREPFDAIVCDESIDGLSGVDFLHRSLVARPSAVRILIIETEASYITNRAANRGRVDQYLLRSEADRHLAAAIYEGLSRRELAIEELLKRVTLPPPVHDSYIALVEDLLENEGIRMVYQPIVAASTGELFGYEALARGTIAEFESPAIMFDAAVAAGLTWPLGNLIRDVVSDDLSQMNIDVPVFVNLHPSELANPELLAGRPFAPELSRQIVFELTERASISNLIGFVDKLQELRGLGFRTAIDDLGAGYASLNSVMQVSPEFIKTDMALIRGIDRSQLKRSLVDSLVRFARSAKIGIIAEGVETPEEAEAVKELGIDYMQGYLIGKPGPLPGG